MGQERKPLRKAPSKRDFIEGEILRQQVIAKSLMDRKPAVYESHEVEHNQRDQKDKQDLKWRRKKHPSPPQRRWQ
jgi:hypothetical protein